MARRDVPRTAVLLLALLWLPTRAAAQPVSGPAIEELQGWADEFVDVYNERGGKQLTREVLVVDPLAHPSPDLLEAALESFSRGALASALPAHLLDSGELQHTDRPLTYDRCAIFVQESALARDDRDARQTLAHEVFHCFIYEHYGPAANRELDDWIVEGLPEWASTVVAGPATVTPGRWLSWLNRPIALGERGYDAFPFHAGLNHWSDKLWKDWHRLLKADETEAISFLRGSYGKELSYWAPSLMRRPEWGPPWDAYGPGAPPESSYPKEIVFFDGETITLRLDALTPFAVDVLLPDGIAARVTVRNAAGGIRDTAERPDAFEEFFEIGFARTLCAGECLCDSGEPPKHFIRLERSTAVELAATAFPGGGTVVIEEVEPECCGPEHRVFPELVGLWRLDTDEAIRQLWAPAPNSVITPSGSLTVSIKEDGTVLKVYDQLSFERVTEFHGGLIEESFDRTNGVVTGCLSTRAIGSMGARSFVFQAQSSVSRAYSLPNDVVVTEHEEKLGLRWGVGNAGNSIGMIVFHGEDSFEIGAARFNRVAEELD